MKKIFRNIILILFSFILVSCTKEDNGNEINIDAVKDVIDYVLSYDNGYDDNMKKHISEKNFYVANYVEFYSLYLGELEVKEYKSEIINFENSDDFTTVYMTIDMIAASKEVHLEENETEDSNEEVNVSGDNSETELRDEVIGEDIPVEVMVKFENGTYVIKSFKEYENLETAKELNEGFNN